MMHVCMYHVWSRAPGTSIDRIIVCVEEACATSISYQVQTGHRHKKREKRMLIGISIRSITSKRSCAKGEKAQFEYL